MLLVCTFFSVERQLGRESAYNDMESRINLIDTWRGVATGGTARPAWKRGRRPPAQWTAPPQSAGTPRPAVPAPGTSGSGSLHLNDTDLSIAGTYIQQVWLKMHESKVLCSNRTVDGSVAGQAADVEAPHFATSKSGSHCSKCTARTADQLLVPEGVFLLLRLQRPLQHRAHRVHLHTITNAKSAIQ